MNIDPVESQMLGMSAEESQIRMQKLIERNKWADEGFDSTSPTSVVPDFVLRRTGVVPPNGSEVE